MAMKGSLIAFAVTAVLGLVGMGALGFALYYPVAPIVRLRHPPINAWTGDWVWPTMIMVGMAWSIGFLLAGALDQYLAGARASSVIRTVAYGATLWLWALVLWAIALHGKH
jgi:hypothetical protein